MSSLPSNLRKQLETVIIKARRLGEEGALKALDHLAVGRAEPWESMTEEQRRLRTRLRAHGRQLGDQLDAKGKQTSNRLIQECAYEHWHRMLFARFLAENHLLMHPEGVAVTLAECDELARGGAEADGWTLAARYASQMLPQIFRPDDPVLQVALAPEHKRVLEKLVVELPADVFTASDSLGWVYQFWQAERKEEVNKSGVKIGADELPAVTQLFTEDYMVDFLLDNTLGAWHAGRMLAANPMLAENAKSEEELRKAATLPDVEWKYLRFIKGEEGKWRPAAGTFDGWPRTAKELKCLDPCMGSGHFVVAMFERLVALRKAEEKLDEATAVVAVISDNLFGLEIDSRCTQIAAFNLALTAWQRLGYRSLPAVNLACSGLAPNAQESDWLKLAGGNQKLELGMGRLYHLFQKANLLGSLINPRAHKGDLFVAAFHELQPLLEKALAQESKDDSAHELAVTAHGIAKAAEILARQFTLVTTNVPYLSRNKQIETLLSYCDNLFALAKTDLATVFLERCLELTASFGSVALVVPRIWMTYTAYYESLRGHLLNCHQFDTVGSIGKNGFETIGGEIVDVALIGLTNQRPLHEHQVAFSDVSGEPTPSQKAMALSTNSFRTPCQRTFLANPGYTIAEQPQKKNPLLAQFVECYEGLSRGDVDRFDRKFWELGNVNPRKWDVLVNSSTCEGVQSGMDLVFQWERGEGELAKSDGARVQGEAAWNHHAIFVSRTHLKACLTYGRIHAQNGVALVPRHKELLLPVLEFCRSEEYRSAVGTLNQKLIRPTGVMDKVPFDLGYWQKIAAEKYSNGLPEPYSSAPTQWLFNGHPKESDQPLQVVVARLLGYQWPRQRGSSFPDCPSLGPDGLEKLEDEDGIVCLPSLRGEAPAAERLCALLAEAYGIGWGAALQSNLLSQVSYAGKTLEDWLRDGFFEQHCALFHQRPFIWHIWDGLKDGFHVLVNYHKLSAPNGEGRRTLEKLIYSYLGDWIDRQRADQKGGIEGSDARLAAALHLKGELEKILEGEKPYDVFVRWKPIHQQAIGWEPDINDGVRMNIRPFMTAKPMNGRGKNVCILRTTPKTIKWEKDRGKEPFRPKGDFPWFWGWDETAEDFTGGKDPDGNRWNDLHYSRAFKQAAHINR